MLRLPVLIIFIVLIVIVLKIIFAKKKRYKEFDIHPSIDPSHRICSYCKGKGGDSLKRGRKCPVCGKVCTVCGGAGRVGWECPNCKILIPPPGYPGKEVNLLTRKKRYKEFDIHPGIDPSHRICSYCKGKGGDSLKRGRKCPVCGKVCTVCGGAGRVGRECPNCKILIPPPGYPGSPRPF